MADAATWSPHHQKKYLQSRVMLHRLIMRAKPDEIIDHQDGNPVDNRKSKLRRCTDMENGRNRKKEQANRVTSSRFKGVSWHKESRKWFAYIRVNKILMGLGYFRDEQDAARAYDVAAIGHHGPFASTNATLSLYPDAVPA